MGFIQLLENAIAYIQRVQKRHDQLGLTLRENGKKGLTLNEGEKTLEKTISQPIEKTLNRGKIAGVDSGFAGQSFYSLDLMLLRTTGVCFTYEDGKLNATNYHPQTSSLPEPIINTQGLEREEFHKFVSLTRLQAEIRCATQLIEHEKPNACLMDGSLILHPMDKPSAESTLGKEYEKTIAAFVKLYHTAEKNACMLIGAIEDSRSTRLTELLNEQHMITMEKNEVLSDVSLLDKALHAGERSMVFPLAEKKEKHTILNDFPQEWANQLFACYIKPSPWDYPLRIEFLSTSEKAIEMANHASKTAYAQSAVHKDYAFPSVLIEADLRAGLKPEEVELVSDKILSKLGRHTLRMKRRDRRPF
ncbi:MAG: DNA double-strand break repair nuclease NurA [Candidatus Diapherotrites archaeon]|uniref:DNA double-strand break repair nuclease NurA n=1 Tax=Candidatus Iainarchaeum sp. TaxID=3101447 RepID=A0A8T4C697_9ARCH|nr:DNA double-strand break repair nuclease NurA [Candidatus Diapherotrites archaeon]